MLKIIFMVLLSVSFAYAAPVQVIFETDMGVDIDDVAALGMLHKLADMGKAEILAVMINSNCPTAAMAAQGVNEYYGRHNVPLGEANSFDRDRDSCGKYQSAIGKPVSKIMPALVLYEDILSRGDVFNVVIVSTGFLNNLSALIRATNLRDLVQSKVSRLVLMGGSLELRKEYNIRRSGVEATKVVFSRWPTPITFSPYLLGARIRTGGHLHTEASEDHVVRRAYFAHFGQTRRIRPSWDQTAVLEAVVPGYWDVKSQGRMVIREDTQTYWDYNTNSNHSYLVPGSPSHNKKMVEIIDEMMAAAPSQGESRIEFEVDGPCKFTCNSDFECVGKCDFTVR